MPINFFKQIAALTDDSVIKIMPPAELREFVEGYYVFNNNSAEGRQLFFNDGYPVVAFMQSAGETMTLHTNGVNEQLSNMWVCGGLLNNVYCNDAACFNDILIVRFYPLTFFKLFGLAHNCFEQKQVFNLSDVITAGLQAFSKRFYSAPVLADRVQVVSGFILQKADQYSYPGVLTDILKLIEQQGILSVKDLLNKYMGRLNYKWLERNFKAYVGLSPKNYFLIKRFLKTYQHLDTCATADLLKVAIDNGYYDDNHLIKDFKRFSGCSPKKYFQNIGSAV